MKRIGNGVGVMFALIGIFWILQGTGIVPIGVMAHQGQWAIIGLVLGIVGFGLIVYINRRTGRKPRATG